MGPSPSAGSAGWASAGAPTQHPKAMVNKAHFLMDRLQCCNTLDRAKKDPQPSLLSGAPERKNFLQRTQAGPEYGMAPRLFGREKNPRGTAPGVLGQTRTLSNQT